MDQKIKAATLEELLSRTVDQILPSREDFEKVLRSKKKLKVYHGIDPTGPELHLGHTTNLFLLQKLRAKGHQVILLIGDFTAMIGDPTGKSSTRRELSHKEVLKNSQDYQKQASKILKFDGPNPVEIKYNSKWLSKMSAKDWFKLAAKVTYQQLVERDMFQKRIGKGQDIFMHEFFYPLMQGYDSVAMDVDLEVGGTDQLFNMMMGRRLMKKIKNKEKFVLTTKLLVNPKTGEKLMNKSEGNLISLLDSPSEMYGKVMSLPDDVVFQVFELSTDLSDEEIKKAKKRNIFDAKKLLAKTLVSLFHSRNDAQKAQSQFEKVFQKGQLPKEAPSISLSTFSFLPTVTEAILKAGVLGSKSEVRRLISAGAIEDENGKIKDPNTKVHRGVYKIGKYRFLRINP